MELGTATAAPGELARGHLDVTALPTGGTERLPVVLANGTDEGPTVWVTAAVHGDEVTALAAAQDAMAVLDPTRLRGGVACIPAMNPAGLRRTTRTSYYHDQDPNRHFPDPTADDPTRPPKVQAVVARRLYDRFSTDADALLDLHTAQVGSLPFVIRDRVLYGEQRDEAAAEALADRLATLADATGLPVVNEYVPAEYVDEDLHRSVAGAALNGAGVPALTVELGSHTVVEEANRAAGVACVFRALVAMDALDAVPGPVAAAAPGVEAPVDYPVRRHVGPHTDTAGVARHHLSAGDTFEAGDVLADVVTPAGEQRATVATDHDGYVVGRYGGVAAYENDPLYSLAVRDDAPLVGPRDPA